MLTLIRGRSAPFFRAKEKNSDFFLLICDAEELKRAAGSLSAARSTSENRRELNNQSHALKRCLRFAFNAARPRPLSGKTGGGNFWRGRPGLREVPDAGGASRLPAEDPHNRVTNRKRPSRFTVRLRCGSPRRRAPLPETALNASPLEGRRRKLRALHLNICSESAELTGPLAAPRDDSGGDMLAAGTRALPENRSAPTERQLSGIINRNSKRTPDPAPASFAPNLLCWRGVSSG